MKEGESGKLKEAVTSSGPRCEHTETLGLPGKGPLATLAMLVVRGVGAAGFAVVSGAAVRKRIKPPPPLRRLRRSWRLASRGARERVRRIVNSRRRSTGRGGEVGGGRVREVWAGGGEVMGHLVF